MFSRQFINNLIQDLKNIRFGNEYMKKSNLNQVIMHLISKEIMQYITKASGFCNIPITRKH